MNNSRIKSLDVLRGMAIMLIILFHSSIYNFANIHRIDFENPPLIIVLMSFMALWGGVFIIYSMVVNSFMILKRNSDDKSARIYIHLTLASLIYLFLHFILNIFLGRWNVDFINNQPHMTFVANAMRGMETLFPPASKFFEGSSLSTIAINLFIVSWMLFFLLRSRGEGKKKRNYMIFGLGGSIIMVFSFVRVYFYDLFINIYDPGFFLSIIYSFTLANPYPILPYLAYGFFGSMLALMIFDQRSDLLKKAVLPLGLLFLVFGAVGAMQFEKTISTPDFFWYFKTNFELGIFLLLISGAYLLFENKDIFLNKLFFLKWFSRVSLSVYLLETFVSEIMRLLINPLYPGWNQTIDGCLIFGVINIMAWMSILFLWSRYDFVYSLEYYWVKLFAIIGKQSTKLK
jgi:peptidoglycan/LPS O-acetylase OafA/YrhL